MKMAVINTIKQKILQLDAGSFQSLCDAFLAKDGYPNIVSLGTEAGSQKTTRGTPDTYFFVPGGRYIFVEYTTQQSGLAAKITEDINKCLAVSSTGIPLEKISEIIYCHTSSNIAPKIDSELRSLCENWGINLTIVGIDRIAEDLYLKHRGIAKEFLGISIDTGQIQERDEFVREYDSKILAAPLDTQFLFRKEEMDNIDEAFKTDDIVILTGSAGTGKTRLALHYAQLHSEKHGEHLFCISDNALPLYEDLVLRIDMPGQYFLFIDDANQLSGLQHVLKYVTMKSFGYRVKVLITVRDYAVSKVKDNAREIASFKEIIIKALTDDEIKKLLSELLGIYNERCLIRITRIAEGNARIAMLAGKIACSAGDIGSIDDVSQLYDSYYGTFLQDSGLVMNKDILITAGVTAFLTAFHLDRIDPILPILKAKEICRDNFIENIYKLHEHEIIDICNDKAVRFSEQCLANFMLKYIFFDKKLLSLTDMTRACFINFKQRTVGSINTLLGVFRNQALHQYVADEIKKLWNELSEEKSPYFFEFIKTFFRVNPTETLLMLQEHIESQSEVRILPDNIDTITGKDYQSVNDDIIKILGGFYNSTDLASALDLYFQYYIKRPDLFIQFYHASKIYFCIRSESNINCYNTQILFFEKLREYSNAWQQKSIAVLFLEIAGDFLKLMFSPAESGDKNTIVIYQLPLIPAEGLDQYRKLIWDSLIELCAIEEYKSKVRKILQSYGVPIDEVSAPVVEADVPFISEIFNSSLSPECLFNSLLAKHIINILHRLDIPGDSLFNNYLNNKEFRIYNLLKGLDYSIDIEYTEREQIKHQQIQKFVSTCDLDMFKEVLDICAKFDNGDDNKWDVINGLVIAFEEFAKTNNCFAEVVKYYTSIGTPLNVYPVNIINVLFSVLSATEVFALINECDYMQKNIWQYVYYHELPEAVITKEMIENLYSFLKNSSDSEIKSSPFRDVDFLEKYRFVDERVFLKGCRIILSKNSYSPFVVHLYFGLLFNKHHNSPDQVIEKFRDDLGLLEEIYIAMISYDKNEDYDGEFLRRIYLASPSILSYYVCYLVELKGYRSLDHNYERVQIFLQLENAEKIYDYIIDEIMKEKPSSFYDVENFMKSLIMPKQGDSSLVQYQDKWIKHIISSSSHDVIKMQSLFSAILKYSDACKVEYIMLFLEQNADFEMFETILLVSLPDSWTGSVIPMLSLRIEFLQLILPNLIGIKFVKHKRCVENLIDSLYKQIEDSQIEEILRG
jgi:energy-coupling factor transporter ATP-binding protein EcfA2/NAD-dependent SIR2 family protein deacetylase